MDIERVWYKHYRCFGESVDDAVLLYYSRGNHTSNGILCKGGKTECHIILKSGQEIVGIAECSLKDNFNYRIGREIAYGRAMKRYCNAL